MKTSKLGKLKGRNRTLVIKVVTVIALASAQPLLWGYVSAAAEAMQQKRSQKQHINELKDRIAQIKGGKETERQFLDQLDAVVPANNSLPQTVERLERLATERQIGLTIVDIKELQTDEDDPNIPIIPLQVVFRASGTPAQLLGYIEAVEHVQELTIIKQWILAAAPPTSPTPMPSPGQVLPTSSVQYTLTMTLDFLLQRKDDEQK